MPEPVAPGKNPNKIMGLPKWAFWLVLAIGLLLAYYLYRRNQGSSANTAATDLGVVPDQSGVTAADIGGTPSDTGTVYQPGDYTAQFDALNSQIGQSESDLATQIAGLASAGVGTSTSAPPNINVTVPVKVVKSGGTKHHKAPPKHKKKPRKKVHH